MCAKFSGVEFQEPGAAWEAGLHSVSNNTHVSLENWPTSRLWLELWTIAYETDRVYAFALTLYSCHEVVKTANIMHTSLVSAYNSIFD